jgi:Zn-finger nucleic acid-binding protein
MQEVTRQDVQLDVCSNCRGVWLDRGELEKLLGSFREQEYDEKYQAPSLGAKQEPEHEYHREHYNDPDRYHRGTGKHKKSAFERLGEIFE